MTFKYMAVASSMHNQEDLIGIRGEYERALSRIGGHRMDGSVADGEEVAFTFVLTGGVENGVIRRHRSRMQQGKTGPLLLIAHSAHSALAAAL